MRSLHNNRFHATLGLHMRKLIGGLFILGFWPVLVSAFEPLGTPLSPLPEEEYERIFNAFQTRERIPIKLLHQGLFAGQTTVRAYSASLLGDHGGQSSVPYLIDALSDSSMHVGARYVKPGMHTTRYWANESLKKLTKKDFGFVWDDPEEKRKDAIQRWRAWYLHDVKTP